MTEIQQPMEHSDKYWRRIKLLAGLFLGSFFLYLFVWMISVPSSVEGSEVTLSTYPLVSIIGYIFIAIGFFGALPFLYFISKDKKELAKDFPDTNTRHWITIGIVSYFSLGIYPVWYLYSRHKKVPNEDDLAESETSTISTNEQLGHDDAATAHQEPPTTNDTTTSPAESATTKSTTEDAFAAVNESLDQAEQLRKKASDQQRDENYTRAIEFYDQSVQAYNDALETANNNELIDSDEIERKLATVTTDQREARREQLRANVASVRAEFDRAETLKESGNLERAKERLSGLDSRLESISQSASQYDLEDLCDEIARLEERQQKQLAEISERRHTDPVPTEIPTIPDITVDYDIFTNREPIGGGGNADVIKATVPSSDGDVTVAIKEPRLSGTLHTDQVDRMLTEAETWDRLDDHDHIVSVVDYGSEPLPWIAMEYMDGGHLGDRSEKMDFSQALWTAIAITKGVRHAHRRGVAHLDLKPENVLFRTVEDAWDLPKVADWGLSKHLLDHSKSVEGLSPHYAAPEQFDDEFGPTDDITDVYQLGAVFYELFTGRPPFEGNATTVMRAVMDQQPTPPSEIADVDSDLDDILLKALAKEKDDRYESVLLLRNDLQSVRESRLI